MFTSVPVDVLWKSVKERGGCSDKRRDDHVNVRQLWLSALKRKVRELNTASQNCGEARGRLVGETLSSCHQDGGAQDNTESGNSVS